MPCIKSFHSLLASSALRPVETTSRRWTLPISPRSHRRPFHGSASSGTLIDLLSCTSWQVCLNCANQLCCSFSERRLFKDLCASAGPSVLSLVADVTVHCS